jgi:hypothetical protein
VNTPYLNYSIEESSELLEKTRAAKAALNELADAELRIMRVARNSKYVRNAGIDLDLHEMGVELRHKQLIGELPP